MMRVSPPELAREFPGPQASTRTTFAPLRKSSSAVHPPKAPAPTTITERGFGRANTRRPRSEEHTSELQSRLHLVCRLLLEKKKKQQIKVPRRLRQPLTHTHNTPYSSI